MFLALGGVSVPGERILNSLNKELLTCLMETCQSQGPAVTFPCRTVVMIEGGRDRKRQRGRKIMLQRQHDRRETK